jgi:hypothetical protein
MSKFRLILTACLTFVLMTLVSAGPTQALDCTTIVGKTYNCTINSETFGLFGDNISFSTSGGKIDWHSNTFGADMRCGCLAKGTLANPKFNTSTSFLCGSDDAPTFDGDAATGKVLAAGKKIKGQYYRRDPGVGDDTRVFECNVQ